MVRIRPMVELAMILRCVSSASISSWMRSPSGLRSWSMGEPCSASSHTILGHTTFDSVESLAWSSGAFMVESWGDGDFYSWYDDWGSMDWE